jgi:hypothetical protein
MKILKAIGTGGVMILLAVGGMMIVTNPGTRDYERYATVALTSYLKEKVCTKVSQELEGMLASYCKSLVDLGNPQLQQLISQQTERQNFLLFSIYRTELSLPAPIPSYGFETLGVWKKFYTYQAEQL